MASTLRRAPAFAVVCVVVLALAGAAGATFNTSRLVSVGTNGTDAAVGFEFASTDGSKVVFSTTDVVAGAVGGTDSDTRKDLYLRSGGVTTLLTPSTAIATNFMGASADGSIVFFNTTEGLDPSDADGLRDIYAVSGGSYTLVTPGTSNATLPAFMGNSADGSSVFFTAPDVLDAADTDALSDVYQRSGGLTTLLTPGTPTVAPGYEAASADGSHVFFSTTEAIAGTGDADANRDVYDRSGGVTTLVTPTTSTAVTFAGIAADGSKLFFTTNQKLDGVNDADTLKDIYSGTVAPYTLVTPSTAVATDYAGNSADGAHVFFTTAENLAGDADGVTDVFDRSGGAYTLVTPGTATAPTFNASSADGTKVYFSSTDSLDAADTDGGLADVFEFLGGTVTLVSKPGAGAGGAAAAAAYGGRLPDGSRAYFTTAEKLTGDDGDALTDVYEALTDGAAPTVTPSQAPNGSNGWFKTAPATLHVAAADDVGLTSLTCNTGGPPVALANLVSTQTTIAGDVVVNADGDVTVACKATDGAQNFTDMTPTHLKLDTQAPGVVLTVTPPASGWFTTPPATLHVVGTDTLSLDSVTCTVDGNPAALANLVVGATQISGDVQVVADGDHTVACTASDSAGNSATGGPQHLMLDTTGPVVSFAQTPNGSNGWFKTAPATVTATATDALSMGTLACTLDGSPVTPANPSSTATARGGDVQTSAPGDHLVSCTGTDTAGNPAVATAHLKLDTAGPTLTPSQTPNGVNGWFKTAPATLHLVTTDALSIGTLTCTLDGSPASLVNVVPTATSIAADLKTSVDGDHLVVCTGTDSAGNATIMPTQHLKLDTSPPAFSFAQTPNGTNGWFKTSPAKVRVTATDASGISTLTCKLDNVATTLGAPASTATTKAGDVSTTAQGSHTVVCTATDTTGNTTTSSTQTLKLDSVAPTLTVANITVDPTGPSGATVSAYGATTSDATSPPVTLACTPPAPKVFPLGNTTVSCTATDQAGNATTKTFTVHVNTVVDSLKVLKGMVTGATPKLGGVLVPILGAQVDFAITYMTWPSKPKPLEACGKLKEFTDRIAQEMAKPKPGMTAAQATSLTAYANKIRTLIPC